MIKELCWFFIIMLLSLFVCMVVHFVCNDNFDGFYVTTLIFIAYDVKRILYDKEK